MFFPNLFIWLKILKDEKARTVLHGFIYIVKKPKHKPNKLYDLIKEENFTITLSKNGYMMIVF